MTWLATTLGIAGGLALAGVLSRFLFGRQPVTRGVIGGLAVALLPGMLVGIVAGAPLGGALGRQVFGELGVPASGQLFGVATGVAAVLALVMLAGGAMGLALAKAAIAYRRWQGLE